MSEPPATTAGAAAHAGAPSDRRAKLKLLLAATVPVWARLVVVLVGATVLTHLVGLGKESGYATMPGIYMIMSPPAGTLWSRVSTVALATLVVAGATALGAELSRWTPAVVVGLAILGTETVDTAALPDAATSFAASWTFLAAAEDLIRMLLGPKPMAVPAEERATLAARLRGISDVCRGSGGRVPVAEHAPERPATLASLAVARMATAAVVLRRGTANHP